MPRLTPLIARKATPWLAAFGSLLPTAAFAALPVVPPGAAPPGDYFGMLRDYAGTGIGLACLIIAAGVFLVVIGAVVGKYREWHMGKADIGELKSTFVVGMMVLAVVITFVTISVGVIPAAGAFANG